MPSTPSRLRRVLIVSANPLFRQGLRKLYADRWEGKAAIEAMPATMEDAVAAMVAHKPDLVIVDYDDKTINRDEFLARFMNEHTPMQIVLVSLNQAGQVEIFDRRTLTSAQAEDWLNNPWNE